jgi:hypothetical protein
MELVSGQFLVGAAGDDISSPDRVEKLAALWEETGFKEVSIYSSADPIDANGGPHKTNYDFSKPCHPPSIAEAVRRETAHVVGATQAITRKVFDRFGPITGHDCHDDEVLPFRALLLDGIRFCPLSLVKYRHHSTNAWSGTSPMTARELRAKVRRVYRGRVDIRNQWLADYLKMPAPDPEIERGLRDLLALAEHQFAVVEKSFPEAVRRTVMRTLKTGSARGAVILLWRISLRLKAMRERFQGVEAVSPPCGRGHSKA